MHLESSWDPLGNQLGSTWDPPGTPLCSTGDPPGIHLGTTWDQLGGHFVSIWVHLASIWDLIGIHLGPPEYKKHAFFHLFGRILRTTGQGSQEAGALSTFLNAFGRSRDSANCFTSTADNGTWSIVVKHSDTSSSELL